MFAPDTFKLFTHYSDEVIQSYCIYDNFGCIVGVKEDAPSEFKEAYEADKRISDEWEELGID